MIPIFRLETGLLGDDIMRRKLREYARGLGSLEKTKKAIIGISRSEKIRNESFMGQNRLNTYLLVLQGQGITGRFEPFEEAVYILMGFHGCKRGFLSEKQK
jgi:hypothetical protein